MPKQKKITIEELAVMVKRGFDDSAKNMEARFSDMEARFSDMEARLIGMDARLNTTATKEDIARIEKDIAELRTDILRIGRFPESLGRRVDQMEDDIRLLKTKARIN